MSTFLTFGSSKSERYILLKMTQSELLLILSKKCEHSGLSLTQDSQFESQVIQSLL